MDILDTLIKDQKSGHPRGIPSICSAHPLVLEAVFKQALKTGNRVLIEATSNQVNQFGGYTGMKPADFYQFVGGMADALGFPRERLVLGGDHLGPLPWVSETAEKAMTNARELVSAYALAGFRKIHLDCSVHCADDRDLSPEIMAARTAELATVVESTCREAGLPFPKVVIGTEVPAAGGAKAGEEELQVTQPEDASRTIELTRQAFLGKGLDAAWDRVIALVVQPGVEFDHTKVVDYQPALATGLSAVLAKVPGMVFEAHSTDYQKPEALAALVEDGFAILKVGPGVTFALREALYALADIEAELVPERARSDLRGVVEKVMVSKPDNWERYYHGNEQEKRLLRVYSYSDRIRYYWADPEIDAAAQKLVRNLSEVAIPENLLSRYLPEQYWQLRSGLIDTSPMGLIQSKVRGVIGAYAAACRA